MHNRKRCKIYTLLPKIDPHGPHQIVYKCVYKVAIIIMYIYTITIALHPNILLIFILCSLVIFLLSLHRGSLSLLSSHYSSSLSSSTSLTSWSSSSKQSDCPPTKNSISWWCRLILIFDGQFDFHFWVCVSTGQRRSSPQGNVLEH